MRQLIAGEHVKTEAEDESEVRQTIYGRVVRSGPKVFYIRWASGAVIRYPADTEEVKLCTEEETEALERNPA